MRLLEAKTNVTIRQQHLTIAAYAFAIVLAFILRYRITPFLSEDYLSLLTYAGDSAHYLRLFDAALASFPQLPASFDYYSNYPWGLDLFLPAVWPHILATLSLPISALLGIAPQQAAGLLMMVLSMAIAVPIYFLARELFGKTVASVSSLIALFHLDFALLGPTGVDHHIADVFLVASIYALFFLARRYFTERNTVRFIVAAVACGGLIALSMLISLSLVLIIGIILAPVVAAIFLLPRDELRPITGTIAAIFGTAASILGVLAVLTPWFSLTLEFSRLSLLHIVVFGVVALGAGAFLALVSKEFSVLFVRSMAAGAILVVVGTIFSVPVLFDPLYKGYLRSIGSYPLGLMTTELEPLFAKGLETPMKYFSCLFFVVPLIFGTLFVRGLMRRELDFAILFVNSVAAILTVYTLYSLYYSIYLSIFIVIAYGFGVTWAANVLSRRARSQWWRRHGKHAISIAGAAIVISFMILGAIDKESLRVDPNLTDLAEFTRNNTPIAGDFLKTTSAPSYGILVDWDRSYQFQYLAKRATISTGNTDAGSNGIVTSTRFFQSESESDAYAIAESVKAKYVVVAEMPFIYEGDIARLTESLPDAQEVAYAVTTDRIESERLHRMIGVRMFWDIAMPEEAVDKAPLKHFRLLYISANKPDKAPFMLYEVVKGARVIVQGASTTQVAISAHITTNTGQTFTWRERGVIDESGLFETRVPYVTGTGPGGISVTPYEIQVRDTRLTFQVDESAVQQGHKIFIKVGS